MSIDTPFNVNIIAFAVDDDAAILHVIGEVLEAAGLPHQLFTSEKALLDNLVPDVHICIVDYYLGGTKTGIDVTKEVLERNPNCIVIALSSQNDYRVVAQLVNAGAQRYIVKGDLNFLHDLRMYVQEAVTTIKERFKSFQEIADRWKETKQMITDALTNNRRTDIPGV